MALTRSRDDRVVAGVLGGVARAWGWPSTRLRIGYIILSVLSVAFPGILLYVVLWIVMPSEDRVRR